jgi:hypothetical protein
MRIILALSLFLIASLPAFAQRGADQMPIRLESKHYSMKAETDKEKAQSLLDFMEIVFDTYRQLLKPDDPAALERKKFVVVLYKDKDSYVASGAPKGSGAYYNGRALVGYYDEYLMWNFFAHEGMHQFTDMTSKNFRNFPMWFNEGTADCFGNSIVKRKKLYMCVKTGAIARMRLPVIQNALKTGKAYPLKKLLTLDRKTFMGDASLCYAQSWSFCHFLMAYPKYEDPSARVPNGSFRKNLAIYYELVRTGEHKHASAWKKAFDDNGYPIELLEKLWKKYVTKWDGPKLMGFSGKELTGEECETLGLGKRQGGIRMEKFSDDSVGKKCGCKDGDILVKVDNKDLPRDGALNTLRMKLGTWPFNRKLKIEVLRGEENERVKLTLVWRKGR